MSATVANATFPFLFNPLLAPLFLNAFTTSSASPCIVAFPTNGVNRFAKPLKASMALISLSLGSVEEDRMTGKEPAVGVERARRRARSSAGKREVAGQEERMRSTTERSSSVGGGEEEDVGEARAARR